MYYCLNKKNFYMLMTSTCAVLQSNLTLALPQERSDLPEIHAFPLRKKNICEVRIARCRLCLWEAGKEAI